MTSIFKSAARAFHALTDNPGRIAADRAHGDELKARLDRLTSALPSASPASRALTGRRWQASPVGRDTFVAASPLRRDAVDFARDCLRHDVRRVVDLRSAKEKEDGPLNPLDGAVKRVEIGQLTADFQRLGRSAPLQGLDTRPMAGDAHVRRVEVRVSRGDTALGPDEQPRPGHAQPLSLIRMPIGDERKISADRLLATSVHLIRAEASEGGKTLFQCADGGHVAATFAVARDLLQGFLRGDIQERHIDNAILMQCLRMCRDHRSDAFRAEDLTALAAFAGKMFEADRRGELQGLPRPAALVPPPKPPRARTATEALVPPPGSSPSQAPMRSILKKSPATLAAAQDKPRVTFAKKAQVRRFATEQVTGSDGEIRFRDSYQDRTRRTVADDGTPVPAKFQTLFENPDADGSDR